MGLKRRFMRTMKGESGTEANPVAEDIFWGTLAIFTFILAQWASDVTHWWGWDLLAAGGIGVFLVREVLRFRVPLVAPYKSTRRVSLFIICALLILCILGYIRFL